MAEVFVTNFNPNFTGVSATAAGVLRVQQRDLDAVLVGHRLPDCGTPMQRKAAFLASNQPPDGKPFSIWHVRRNPEMRVALWARDVLRMPIKIVFTSAAQRRHSMYPRWLISRMDAVIATTQEAATFVPHVRAVVPHGVDTSRFVPPEDKTEAWKSLGHGGSIGIATVGRIRPEKGTDLFVDTMIKVLPNHPDAVALVIGRASREHQSFEQELKRRVEAVGLDRQILFVGEVAPEDMPRVMQSISLLVALPRYEGYGMTPLEAMASGSPFVASDTGYYAAFSGDGQAGRVVPLFDVDGASREVEALLGDRGQLNTMSQTALERVRAEYSIEKEAAGIREVYDALWAAG